MGSFRLFFIAFVLLFLPCGEAGKGFAQQIGMYSHSFFKPMVFNPAFTGINDETNIMLISRSQWTDFKGAPQLTIFTVDGNLMDKKIGLGFGLVSDRKGITNRTSGNLYYSYKLNLNDNMRLLFGLSFGMADQSIDFSGALTENNTDPTLYSDSRHKTSFDGNAGIAFFWKGLELGAGVPQIIGSKAKPVDNIDSANVRGYYTQARHYMVSVKYKFLIAKEKGISIAPQGLVRFVPNTPFQFDGGLNLDWNDKVWIGGTYKSDYAVSANIGFCVHKQLCVGYSYDFIIGSIGKFSGMSHEIMINFKLGKSKKPEQVTISTPVTILENPEYEKQFDKLQEQLKKNKGTLKELNDKFDNQAKKQLVAPKKVKQKPPVQSSKPGNEDSDGIFVIGRSDFKDSRNVMAEKGYYVIVGIFFYRDFAKESVNTFSNNGYKNTDLLYFESTQNNYVFTHKLESKEEAFKKVKEVNASGANKSWILQLTD